jgi:similar to stage IV sporulation protein
MLNSYIEFTAFGVHSNEFINELINCEHKVWDITSDSNTDIFTVKASPLSYPSIARIAKTYRVKTKVEGRSGIYFHLRRYRKRFGILLGMLAFFFIIVLMSNFIWSIRITGLSGDSQIGRWQILEQLEKSGIHSGVHIEGYNANQAEIEMVLAIEELAWVSIERSGSRINVKVSERLPENEEAEGIGGLESEVNPNEPCNIIADRSGQLIKAEVYRGKLLYEVGSGINKGDVVVTGIIIDVNADSLTTYIHADAKLIIEAAEVVDFYQSHKNLNRAKNGRSKTNRSVVFLGKRFGGEIEVNRSCDYVEYHESMTAPKFFGFPLPIRVLEQRYVFYDRVEVTDSPAVTSDKLNSQIEIYEANFLEKAEIIEKTVEYFPDNDGIGALVRYIIHVDAAQKQVIDN